MPDHGGSRVTQLVLAGSLVVVTQQEVVLEYKGWDYYMKFFGNRIRITHVQAGQAVPAEDVLATLAHHLGTALVLLNGHRAHGAALDQLVVERYPNVVLAIGNQPSTKLVATNVWMVLRVKRGRGKTEKQ